MSTLRAVVTDIRLHSQQKGQSRWQIALDRTPFHAGDRGVLRAISRSGAVLEVAVLDVEEDAGELWHATEKPLLAETEVEAIVAGTR